MGEAIEQLKTYLYRPIDLMHAGALLSWDQEVYMPEQGVQARSEQLSTLSALAHEMITAEESGRLLEAAEAEAAALDYDSDDASLVRVVRRGYDRSAKLPTEWVIRATQTASKAFVAWRQAREENNYAIFQPLLQETVDICLEQAEYLGYEEHPYDALLDQYEPGMKTADVERLFTDLKAGLVPLIQEITACEPIDDSFFAAADYDTDRQWEFTLLLLRDIGYDFTRGRQDKAPHPFTINFGATDVRVTTRLYPRRPQSAIFSSVHEGGHALYEQGSPQQFERTSLAGGATLGLHESQSRLWENQVGRSLAFWQHYFPIFRAFFPEALGNVTLEQFHRGINKVQPDFIRVEADEVTYNLHIFVRFELEKALMTRQLKVADVPDAWNARYEEYLGITPPDDAFGCLQDIHWSHGTIGYFPTYTLGNLMSAQLYAQAQVDLPGLEAGFTRGEFRPLLDWLREKVHRYGCKFTAAELLQRSLGQEIQAQPLLDYMRAKYTALYNL